MPKLIEALRTIIFSSIRLFARAIAGRGLGLARIPGVHRVYDWCYRRFRPSGLIVLDVHGSKMVFDTRVETPLYNLAMLGTYEAFETGVLQSLLRTGMTVIDIGANIGYYTILFARIVGPGGRVFSFEPDPRNFALLERSIEANHYCNVVAKQVALSDQAGEVVLHADAINAGNSCLAVASVQRHLCSYEVQANALDDFMADLPERVDLIKMDVQGAEGLVLAGGRRTFSRAQTVMMEFEPAKLEALGSSPAALLDDLKNIGFRARVLDEAAGAITELPRKEMMARSRQDGYVNLLLERVLPTSERA